MIKSGGFSYEDFWLGLLCDCFYYQKGRSIRSTNRSFWMSSSKQWEIKCNIENKVKSKFFDKNFPQDKPLEGMAAMTPAYIRFVASNNHYCSTRRSLASSQHTPIDVLISLLHVDNIGAQGRALSNRNLPEEIRKFFIGMLDGLSTTYLAANKSLTSEELDAIWEDAFFCFSIKKKGFGYWYNVLMHVYSHENIGAKTLEKAYSLERDGVIELKRYTWRINDEY